MKLAMLIAGGAWLALGPTILIAAKVYLMLKDKKAKR
jgi:hypothetical protein